jgi:hypothetical protein
MTKKTWKIAALFSVTWIIFMLIYRGIINNGLNVFTVASIITSGSVAGIVFAMISSYWSRWKYRNTVIDLPVDEKVIVEGGGTLKKNNATIPGKLVLTGKRLIFKSYNVSITSEETYLLNHIVNAKITSELLDNGFEITLANGNIFRFTIGEPQLWVDRLSGKPD